MESEFPIIMSSKRDLERILAEHRRRFGVEVPPGPDHARYAAAYDALSEFVDAVPATEEDVRVYAAEDSKK